MRAGSWGQAVDLAIADPGLVVVTDEGDRFGHAGWRIGAAGGGATAAALEEATTKASSAQQELARLDTSVAGARAELQAARQHEQELTRRLDAHDAGFSANSEAYARAQAERRESLGEMEYWPLSRGSEASTR